MRLVLLLFLWIPLASCAQSNTERIINEEYEKGHFNGTLLFVDGSKSIKLSKGFSNFQFSVEINDNTRFPIASITKLFTSIAILQLHEKGLINFSDAIGKFISDLPENCRHITIRDLLTHHSGLENEPIKAVVNKYSIDEYIRNFVHQSPEDTLKFNYNNVDFVLLSKIVEKVTSKSFSKAMADLILKPLNMNNTGFVMEDKIIENLAYGYHNYSFGEGEKDAPLFNDRRYISNYYGAGGIYSTTEDLYTLLIAIKNNIILSEESKRAYLLNPQSDEYIDWLSGKPTFGFYFDSKANVFRRSGSIDGFNSEIIVSQDFSKILIILCNTDTADLFELSNNIFFEKQ